MRRADVDDHADVGIGDRGQLGDLPGAAHRHLEHERARSGRRREHHQRQADLGVEVGRRAGGRDDRAEQRREDVLGRGLAGRAGDRDHLGPACPSCSRHARASACSAASGSAVGEHVAGARSCAARVARARGPRARPRRRARAPPARARRRPRARRAARRTARPAADRARVDRARAAGPPRRRLRARTSRAAGERREPLGVPVPHPPRPRPARRCAPASASRATVTSSKGTLRPPASSWPCSWPLPAITTTSPGRASADAARSPRAGRRSTRPSPLGRRRPGHAVEDLGDDRCGVLRARVVGGHDRDVGEPRRDLAHQRALAAVAVAAGAEHADHAAPAAAAPRGAEEIATSSRAAASTFSSESGVWA